MISKALAGASARPIMLSLLTRGESYGYEIIQRIQVLSGGALLWNDGTLYPVLHRLEHDGLVVSEWRASDVGRRRKYYRITAKGKKELEIEKQQWLSVHSVLSQLWGLQPQTA
jgi:PadR family transcriptional regulator, regulatory protein PadR